MHLVYNSINCYDIRLSYFFYFRCSVWVQWNVRIKFGFSSELNKRTENQYFSREVRVCECAIKKTEKIAHDFNRMQNHAVPLRLLLIFLRFIWMFLWFCASQWTHMQCKCYNIRSFDADHGNDIGDDDDNNFCSVTHDIHSTVVFLFRFRVSIAWGQLDSLICCYSTISCQYYRNCRLWLLQTARKLKLKKKQKTIKRWRESSRLTADCRRKENENRHFSPLNFHEYSGTGRNKVHRNVKTYDSDIHTHGGYYT